MPAQFAQVDVTFLVDQNGMLDGVGEGAAQRRAGAGDGAAGPRADARRGRAAGARERRARPRGLHRPPADRVAEQGRRPTCGTREKALAQAGDRLTPTSATAIDAATATLQAAIAGGDLEALQQAIDAFAAATNPLAHDRDERGAAARLERPEPRSARPDHDFDRRRELHFRDSSRGSSTMPKIV